MKFFSAFIVVVLIVLSNRMGRSEKRLMKVVKKDHLHLDLERNKATHFEYFEISSKVKCDHCLRLPLVPKSPFTDLREMVACQVTLEITVLNYVHKNISICLFRRNLISEVIDRNTNLNIGLKQTSLGLLEKVLSPVVGYAPLEYNSYVLGYINKNKEFYGTIRLYNRATMQFIVFYVEPKRNIKFYHWSNSKAHKWENNGASKAANAIIFEYLPQLRAGSIFNKKRKSAKGHGQEKSFKSGMKDHHPPPTTTVKRSKRCIGPKCSYSSEANSTNEPDDETDGNDVPSIFPAGSKPEPSKLFQTLPAKFFSRPAHPQSSEHASENVIDKMVLETVNRFCTNKLNTTFDHDSCVKLFHHKVSPFISRCISKIWAPLCDFRKKNCCQLRPNSCPRLLTLIDRKNLYVRSRAFMVDTFCAFIGIENLGTTMEKCIKDMELKIKNISSNASHELLPSGYPINASNFLACLFLSKRNAQIFYQIALIRCRKDVTKMQEGVMKNCMEETEGTKNGIDFQADCRKLLSQALGNQVCVNSSKIRKTRETMKSMPMFEKTRAVKNNEEDVMGIVPLRAGGGNAKMFDMRRKNPLICKLCIRIHPKFAKRFGFSKRISRMTVMLEIADIISMINWTFRSMDFNSDGTAENVGFKIQEISIGLRIADRLSAMAILEGNRNPKCCAKIEYTYENLAPYISTAHIGGVCSGKNIAIVSGAFNNRKLAKYDIFRATMHGLGHLFGSNHDDLSNSFCADENIYSFANPFLMHPVHQMNVGIKPNSFRMSSCSKISMAVFLNSAGSSCLQAEKEAPFCGNGIKEDGEECDCGSLWQCSSQNHCCGIKESFVSCKIPSHMKQHNVTLCSLPRLH